MIALLCFALAVLVAPFKSKSRLEAENAALRHQLIVLRRKMHGRVRLTNNDRLFFIWLYRWFPSILKVLTIIRPETSFFSSGENVMPLGSTKSSAAVQQVFILPHFAHRANK